MATLRHHTLIYDRDCPMCRAYTGTFVKRGWLDGQGRMPYSDIEAGDYCGLDLQRAKDEIALIDGETGEVVYGLQGLIKVVSHRWPLFQNFLLYRPVRWVLQRLYYFISYNRKVIVAVQPSCRPCNPSFHLGYRLAWLLFTFFTVSVILTAYAGTMATLLPEGGRLREYAVCGGQVLFQGLVLFGYRRPKMMDYLGNMMTVSLMGALALLPMLLVSHWLPAMPLLFAGYFLLVAGGMLLEHLRRMKLLQLGLLPSMTWILYRLLVVTIIFFTGT